MTKDVEVRNPVNLFDLFNARCVGYDSMLSKMLGEDTSNYPPHNIYKDGDNVVLEIAVAGFSQDDIEVEEHDSILTVKATKKILDDTTRVYLHRGIGARSFIKKFRIAQHHDVVSAVFKDGIISVMFKLNIPEDKKPRRISLV